MWCDRDVLLFLFCWTARRDVSNLFSAVNGAQGRQRKATVTAREYYVVNIFHSLITTAGYLIESRLIRVFTREPWILISRAYSYHYDGFCAAKSISLLARRGIVCNCAAAALDVTLDCSERQIRSVRRSWLNCAWSKRCQCAADASTCYNISQGWLHAPWFGERCKFSLWKLIANFTKCNPNLHLRLIMFKILWHGKAFLYDIVHVILTQLQIHGRIVYFNAAWNRSVITDQAKKHGKLT